MSTQKVAARLVELCQQGANMQAVNELYADDVVSVEAGDDPTGQMPRVWEGKEAVVGKGTWWFENHVIHSGEVKGPYFHGDDRFAVWFGMDITPKAGGERMLMQEVGVYTVEGGKIAREEFYNAM